MCPSSPPLVLLPSQELGLLVPLLPSSGVHLEQLRPREPPSSTRGSQGQTKLLAVAVTAVLLFVLQSTSAPSALALRAAAAAQEDVHPLPLRAQGRV